MTHPAFETLPCASLVPVMQSSHRKGILGGCREAPAARLSLGGRGGFLGEQRPVGLERPWRRWPQMLGHTQVALEFQNQVSAAGWGSCSLGC